MKGIEYWLIFFEKVSCFYHQMLMVPLWCNHPNHQTNIWDSLAVFLEGYAFERQGRRPDYFFAATDSLFECRQENNTLTYKTVERLWQSFSQRLNNTNLNPKNNPLYPSSNPNNIQGIGNSRSLLEIILNNQLQQASFVNHLRFMIERNNNVKQAFELMNQIRGIGPKIASLFLRDVVITYEVDLANVQNRYLLQPIDIWVQRTISHFTNIPGNQKQVIAEWIVKTSIQYHINPELVNMGVWFFCSTIIGSEYRLQSTILNNLKLAKGLVHQYYLKVLNTSEQCKNFE